jgi:hypothetical protein
MSRLKHTCELLFRTPRNIYTQVSNPDKIRLALKNHLRHQRSPRQRDLSDPVRHGANTTNTLEHTRELLHPALRDIYVISQVSSPPTKEAIALDSPSASEESSATRSEWFG